VAREHEGSPSPRRHALEVVSQALSPTGRGFAQDLLDERLTGAPMKAEDRRLAAELAYGVIRRLATLDAVLAAYSSQTPEQLESGVLQVLRQGLYQLMFLERIPAHAAVDESVRLVRDIGKDRAAGFVNGILRNIGRELTFQEKPESPTSRRSFEIAPGRACRFQRDILPETTDEAARLAIVHSFPQVLVQRWLKRFGKEQVELLMVCANRPAPTFVRPNLLRTDLDRLAEALRSEKVDAMSSPSGRTLSLPSHAVAGRLKAFGEGLCTVQDDSSAAVAPFLGPKPGEHVADLCAAPGGKACHMAELMSNNGILAAVDVSARRSQRVVENVQRLGIGIVANVEADAAEFCAQHPGKFDRILLDAPCSNTGVLRRRVEARWRFSEGSLHEIARKQREMLTAALTALRPGGVLVYSTCSLEPEENSLLVSEVLAGNPAFRLDAQEEILPAEQGGDGMFMARIVSGGGAPHE
jgi:16S rRNA (cytosine967-C5)-methyltransferase